MPSQQPRRKRGWIAVLAAIGVVIVLIGVAFGLTSLGPNQPPTPTLPNCKSTSNCQYPSSAVLVSGAAGMCSADNSCKAQHGGGFACILPNNYTLGCHLTYNYTSFRITWSASGPLGVGVGSNGNDCKWFDGGYCTWTKATSSGNQSTNANWGLDGRVWFEVVNPGTTIVTIYSLTITAITGPGAPKPLVTFSGVTKVNAVTWTFSVASAQPAVAVLNYKLNFGIGTNTGTAVNMGPTTANITVSVSGATPANLGVKWVDLGGTGQVKGGDIIVIVFPSAPTSGTALTFYLLYSDGSQIQSQQWQG